MGFNTGSDFFFLGWPALKNVLHKTAATTAATLYNMGWVQKSESSQINPT